LKPGEFTEVPYELGSRLAGDPDYKCEDPGLIGEYSFVGEDGMYLGWSSPLMYSDGYGSIAQEIASEFLRMGVGLSIFPRDYTPEHPMFGSIAREKWVSDAFVPANIFQRLEQEQKKCFYGVNMTFPKEACNAPFPRTIGYTMFETTKPPADWVAPMNLCRRLMVPCKQNKEAFETAGVDVPIDVVPLGVNPDWWTCIDRKAQLRKRPFTFLMAAGITYRKNPVGAAEAFVRAFHHGEDVQLILKTRANAAWGFRAWIDDLPQDERIKVICKDSTPTEMRQWMWNADAFVFPSHGEGFGLTPLQAMATGLPTIVSDNSGMSEYCNKRYNYPIKCEEVPVPPNNEGGYPDEWGDVGNWWNPDFDRLVGCMREVYEDRRGAYKKGMSSAEWVRENWTVNHTCANILDVVANDAVDCQ
jgi:glycosyltransferase involved in cell wall biosynthesis